MADPRETEIFLFMAKNAAGAPIGIEHALRALEPVGVLTADEAHAPAIGAYALTRGEAGAHLDKLRALGHPFEQLRVVRVLARIAPEEYPTHSVLWLLSAPISCKISAIKAVREMLGLSLKDAKDLVEHAPCEVGPVDKERWTPSIEGAASYGVRWEWR